jgi:N-acyl-phosphatidylethanolamine-hydrolysing phospholipase D
VTRPPHHAPGGGFRNPWPNTEPPGFGELFRWWCERRSVRRPPRDPRREIVPPAIPRFRTAPPDGLAVTWLGHSTLLIESGAAAVLTDPVFGDYASPIALNPLRRWSRMPITLEELPRLDVVVISHSHYDPLDARTVRRLSALQPRAVWVCPPGLSPLLRDLGARTVEEIDWWVRLGTGRVWLTATPAQHFSARGPHDRNCSLWSGYAIELGARKVYFAGDTGYHPEFRAIGEKLGPFDVLLLPIGAYEPRWFMRVMHMNPEEAIRAAIAIHEGAAEMASADFAPPAFPAVVPIHWGTFKLTDEPMDEPPRRAREAWNLAGLPDDRFWLLAPGETRADVPAPESEPYSVE